MRTPPQSNRNLSLGLPGGYGIHQNTKNSHSQGARWALDHGQPIICLLRVCPWTTSPSLRVGALLTTSGSVLPD